MADIHAYAVSLLFKKTDETEFNLCPTTLGGIVLMWRSKLFSISTNVEPAMIRRIPGVQWASMRQWNITSCVSDVDCTKSTSSRSESMWLFRLIRMY